MKFYWKKLGQIYTPENSNRHPKLLSHAANPLPIHLYDDVYRIFFSGRDSYNRSSVGAVDVDILKRQVIKEHYTPFFLHGEEGCFFSNGVSLGNVYVSNGITYMLFMGWQNPASSHWRGDIGRLILTKEFELILDSEQPFITSDLIDPISLSYPWVLMKDSSFTMWYGATHAWDIGNGEMLHAIHSASSNDGNQWVRHGLTVPYQLGVAQAFSRPSVIYDEYLGFCMWFSFRGNQDKYKIGFAESEDGKKWFLRLNDSGIDVSSVGWDSEMIEYPYVFKHKGVIYMLYNGNGYGKTGFGIAIMQ